MDTIGMNVSVPSLKAGGRCRLAPSKDAKVWKCNSNGGFIDEVGKLHQIYSPYLLDQIAVRARLGRGWWWLDNQS